ncbi:MAG: cupin domain-containing protein [Gemmatimonadota bacterium]
MNLYDPAGMPELTGREQGTRPAVHIAENSPDARLLLFRLAPGQTVATHTSASSVFIAVLSGHGFVTGEEGERPVTAGMVAAIAPREPHGMRAGASELVLAALVAPRPGG